jgi:hypothetical protein
MTTLSLSDLYQSLANIRAEAAGAVAIRDVVIDSRRERVGLRRASG